MQQIQPVPKRSIIMIGICLLLFMLGLPVLFKLTGLFSFKINAIYLYFNELYFWIALALLFLYANKIEKQKFLIWNETSYPIRFYLKSIFKILLVIVIISVILGLLLKLTGHAEKSDKIIQVLKATHNNKFLILLIPLTAGFTEELICRGYLLTRLDLLIKKPTVSILISSVLFGILHVSYGTLGQIIVPFFIGLIFAIHYFKYRNVKIIIISHFLWDFLILLVQNI